MLLHTKGCGGERFRKRLEYYSHVGFEKLNESELTDEASKSWTMSKWVCTSTPRINVEATCLLSTWHPALRQRELKLGRTRERENLLLARNGKQGRTYSY